MFVVTKMTLDFDTEEVTWKVFGPFMMRKHAEHYQEHLEKEKGVNASISKVFAPDFEELVKVVN